MTKRSVRTTALALTIVFVAQCRATEDLPSDSRVLTGKLENGLRWMYRQHDNPPGKMAMLVHVRAGSLNETDAQRGLAHFVERMVFNGSENFAPGNLAAFFQSIGTASGPEANGLAGFDQTAYWIFLPDTRPAHINMGLMVLSDLVFRASFPQEQIDRERGVILEQLRSQQSTATRLRDKLFSRLFAGSRFATRMPIGTEAVIAGASRGDLEGFYRTWYRPRRMTLILLGDAAPEPIPPMIERWFGQYEPAVAAQPEQGPELRLYTRPRAIVLTDPEYPSAEVVVANILPGRPPPTTVEQKRSELVERLAGWIVDRRLSQHLSRGQASYQSASVRVANFARAAVLVNASSTGQPEMWDKMLAELIVEINRGREFGFTQREFELAKSELTSVADQAVRSESNRGAREMLFAMAAAVNEGAPILSAQQELELTRRLLPTIELAELQAAFAKHLAPGAFAYVLQMPEKEGVEVPAEEEVLVAAEAALARKVTPPPEVERPAGLLAAEPTPGALVESTFDEELAITSAWLENGARVHHRRMDQQKDTVLLSFSLAGGQIEETAENFGISEVAALAFQRPATSRLTSRAIAEIIIGRSIRVRAEGTDDRFLVRITGSREDLELGLQLAHALLTEARLEEIAFKRWKESSLRQLKILRAEPGFRAGAALRELLSGGDRRWMFPTPQQVERQSVSAAQAWLDRLCRRAPLEVAIVGDVTFDQTRPLIEKYIGSLPPRPRSAAHLEPLRKFKREAGPLEARIQVESAKARAMVLLGFVGCDARDVDADRQLQLAAKILESRLGKQHEDSAQAYTLQVGHQPGLAYQDSGVFAVGGPCDPSQVEELVKQGEALLQAFAESGPTAEELEMARQRLLSDLDSKLKTPQHWRSVLQNLDLHKVALEKQKTIKEDYRAYTAEQVRETFRGYYTPARAFRVVAFPTAPRSDSRSETSEARPASRPH